MPLIDVERTLDQRRRILAVAIDLVPGPPPMDTFESHLAAGRHRMPPVSGSPWVRTG